MKHVNKIIEAVSLGLLHGAVVAMALKAHPVLGALALVGLLGQGYVRATEE